MLRTTTLLIILCFSFTLYAQNNNLSKDAKGNPMLIGEVVETDFKKAPFSDWYTESTKAYEVNNYITKTFKDSLKHYDIKIFLGTWCGDSKRGVPQFLKVLDKAKFPKKQCSIYALDNKEGEYKKSPQGFEKHLNIHRVPTFIFYKNGKEVNRIVESPRTTFENDIHRIVISKKYYSNYYGVTFLEEQLKTKGLDSLKQSQETDNLKITLSKLTKSDRELNTYGYIKMNDKKYDDALFIFKLNADMHPYSLNAFDSLAEAYFKKANYTQALKNYYKALSLNPSNENAKEMIEKINTLNK